MSCAEWRCGQRIGTRKIKKKKQFSADKNNNKIKEKERRQMCAKN